MIEDAELLRRHVEEHAEEAFAELVRRHLDFVYSSALRQVNGDTHLARDVAQLVFTDLARKAAGLRRRRMLSGWLFVSTRYAAAKLIRTERRRQARELEAHAMETLSEDSGSGREWERIRPVLDAAIAELGETDREAILLRFFEGRGFAEIGDRLQANENTARMRVDRALDKLHGLLVRRGVTSTAGALAMALANQAIVAAPSGLAVTVTSAALTATAGAGAAAGVVTFMSMTKLQLGIASAVAVAGVSGLAWQQTSTTELRRDLAQLQAEATRAVDSRTENTRLRAALSEVQQLRGDDSELARLRDEAAVLRKEFEARARAMADEKQRQEKLAAEAREASTKKAAMAPGQIDRLPVPTSRVQPLYPEDMARAEIGGAVVVSFVVDANGRVRDAFPAKSTRPEFEAAAVEAVKKWTFDPGVKGGRLVNTRLEQPISFTRAGGAQVNLSELAPADNIGWF